MLDFIFIEKNVLNYIFELSAYPCEKTKEASYQHAGTK